MLGPITFKKKKDCYMNWWPYGMQVPALGGLSCCVGPFGVVFNASEDHVHRWTPWPWKSCFEAALFGSTSLPSTFYDFLSGQSPPPLGWHTQRQLLECSVFWYLAALPISIPCHSKGSLDSHVLFPSSALFWRTLHLFWLFRSLT